MNSVGVQVIPEEVKRTEKIGFSRLAFQRSLSHWCEWPDGKICRETQTPVKNPSSRPGRTPKRQPPLIDPLTGLEIRKRRHSNCQNELETTLEGDMSIVNDEGNDSDKVAVKKFKISDSFKGGNYTSVGSQVSHSEMLRTSKIESKKSWIRPYPAPSSWACWLDGRISICTQTPVKRPKPSVFKPPKKLPPLVDPLTGLQQLDRHFTDSGVQVIVMDLMKTKKIDTVSCATGLPSPSKWCRWVDGRICLSTQTSGKGRRKPGKPPTGRTPPLVDPLTGQEIKSPVEAGVTHAGASSTNVDVEEEMPGYEIDVDELIMAEIMHETDSESDNSDDSTQLYIVESKEIAIQVDLPQQNLNKPAAKSADRPSVAEWIRWPDSRQCRSSQTSYSVSKRRNRKKCDASKASGPTLLSWSVIAPNLVLPRHSDTVEALPNFKL